MGDIFNRLGISVLTHEKNDRKKKGIKGQRRKYERPVTNKICSGSSREGGKWEREIPTS